MSFDIKLSFKSDKEPEKSLLISNEASDKNSLLLAIVGPNSQQTTFRVSAVDLVVGLRSIFPEFIQLHDE